MIPKSQLESIVRKTVGRTHSAETKVSLDKTDAGPLKHLRVVTNAWKTKSRMERIGKLTKAIFSRVPAAERGHIISIGVFTADEWKGRMDFTRKLSRLGPNSTRKKSVTVGQSTTR